MPAAVTFSSQIAACVSLPVQTFAAAINCAFVGSPATIVPATGTVAPPKAPATTEPSSVPMFVPAGWTKPPLNPAGARIVTLAVGSSASVWENVMLVTSSDLVIDSFGA